MIVDSHVRYRHQGGEGGVPMDHQCSWEVSQMFTRFFRSCSLSRVCVVDMMCC